MFTYFFLKNCNIYIMRSLCENVMCLRVFAIFSISHWCCRKKLEINWDRLLIFHKFCCAKVMQAVWYLWCLKCKQPCIEIFDGVKTSEKRHLNSWHFRNSCTFREKTHSLLISVRVCSSTAAIRQSPEHFCAWSTTFYTPDDATRRSLWSFREFQKLQISRQRIHRLLVEERRFFGATEWHKLPLNLTLSSIHVHIFFSFYSCRLIDAGVGMQSSL